MKNVFLVGMPSSGKSTVGKALSTLLHYAYIDLDHRIEQKLGKPISAVFSEQGESYFREVESQLLKEIVTDSGLVVATGGGVPCFFDNMDFIKANGISVFLDVPAEELISRIEHHGVSDRPLLAKMTMLGNELRTKLEYRYPFYSRADVTIHGVTDAETVYSKIIHLLS